MAKLRDHVASYLNWLEEGNESEHLERVRRVIGDEWVTRKEIRKRSAKSNSFCRLAPEVLVELGEVEKELVEDVGLGNHKEFVYRRVQK